MTKEEAIVYFGGDEENAFDAFETFLFEFKQYFLTKPIVSKLYQAQFKKLEVLKNAASAMGFDQRTVGVEYSEKVYSFDILEAFGQFEKGRSEIKQRIINTASATELLALADALLLIQARFLDCWPKVEFSDLNGVVISKEPDPMDLLRDIKDLATQGVVRFDQLTISNCETHVTFSNEWKRLSLLRQKEFEWKEASSKN